MASNSSADLGDVRRTLARFARGRDTKVVPKNLPCDWRPHCIISPVSGAYFTPQGAWGFIGDLLDNGFPMEKKALDVPLGSFGYEMLYDTEAISIYIKVQLGHGVIIGRSFHPPYYRIERVRPQ